MNIVGLMLVRNEDWIIEFSLRAAMSWCDKVLVLLDRCTDDTERYVLRVAEEHDRAKLEIITAPPSSKWDEMDLRQTMLIHAVGQMGASHLALIDADEALTANLIPEIRGFFSDLKRGELLDLPMIAARSLQHYHDDSTVWSTAAITTGFAMVKGMSWKAAKDGYQHHNRAPYGHVGRSEPLGRGKSRGGVIHLQFANERRLLAKHVLYRMVDHLRWPGRETIQKLNWKYDQALDLRLAQFAKIKPEWWAAAPQLIRLDGEPYQEQEIKKLVADHGREAFAGLDLKGF